MKFDLVLDYTLPSTWPKIYLGQSGLSHTLKTPFVSLDKQRIIHAFIYTVLPWFSNIYNYSFTFHPHLLPTFSFEPETKMTCLKHMTSSTLVKCNSMIISIVMPSYPNVTLFLCYISEHWTTARTLNMTINHKIP